MIRAVVGAGGKTSLIKKMTADFLAEGKSVFVTTSTHMFIEDDTLLTDDAEVIIRQLKESNYAMAGTAEGEKIRELPYETYCRVCEAADEVLVEADGSKHMPLKFPNENEPVIYDNVDEIIVVCGLHGLGMKACDAVHRLELAQKYIEFGPETIIRPEHIKQLLVKGYLEPLKTQYPAVKVSVYFTGAEIPDELMELM
jgi:xanthine dehydrogenase accessory factor